jgi:UDP-N-acetylmuramate-alanine ligase
MKARVCAQDLVDAIRERGGHSEPGGSVEQLPHRVAARYLAGDLVLVLGAGDVDKAMEAILAHL